MKTEEATQKVVVPVVHGGDSAGQEGQNKPTSTMPQFTLPDQPLPKACKAADVHTLSLFDLSGKTALVTGANGGIGGSMAHGLAEAGADIIIFQIPGENSDFYKELASSTGRKTYVYDCDLGNSSSIRSTVQKVLDDGHNVDILCNVAGISSGSIPILYETDEHKDAVSAHGVRDSKQHISSLVMDTHLLLDHTNQLQRGVDSVSVHRQTHGRA